MIRREEEVYANCGGTYLAFMVCVIAHFRNLYRLFGQGNETLTRVRQLRVSCNAGTAARRR